MQFFFVYCCKVCCIWQTQVCVTRLHDKLYVSVFSFFVWVFLHYCKIYYHWYQKIWLPELQFLSQKSLQHSHFLCIVMCAVLYKSKFSNSATHQFSFRFSFYIIAKLIIIFSKNMFAWIAVFVAKKFATQPFPVYCCNVCRILQAKIYQ